MNSPRLPREFFASSTLEVARNLLGHRLVRILGRGKRLSGMIVETEAYIGTNDLGCHARAGRTARNASMWGPPGHAYVYFTYGMHWMLNIVTEPEGLPAAVLIRAIVPVEGVETMRKLRETASDASLTDGPAKLCQAMNIDDKLDGHALYRSSSRLFLEQGQPVSDALITTGPRVGLFSVPEPWKSIPWRFRVLRGLSGQLAPPEKSQRNAAEEHPQ